VEDLVMINRTKPFLAWVILVLLITTQACDIDKQEKQTTTKQIFYQINPQTILSILDEGKNDIFYSPTSEPPEIVPKSKQKAVTWTQDDYSRIAYTLHRYVWNESMDDWKLDRIDFFLGCADVDYGIQNMRFEFFKNIQIGNHQKRMVELIDIDPRNNYVNLFQQEYNPKLVDWREWDQKAIRFSADDILAIAERNSGKTNRLLVANRCNIQAGLAGNTIQFYGWLLEYVDLKDQVLLRFEVDPYTGNIKDSN
jgi:hypothetical protein